MRTLALAELHAGLGARFGEFAGWRMPLWYGGAVQEHEAVRRAAGIFDISHMGRFEVLGAAAATALGCVFSRTYEGMADGASLYCLACNEAGGIIDDLIIYRLADARFIVICNAANKDKVGAILGSEAFAGLAVRDLQPGSVLLAVQGPEAVERVVATLGSELLAVGRRACAELSLGGATYFCARTGYTGEDGFEIITDVESGKALFERLLADGCTPCGLAGRDSLRLEAALPLHGVDIDETTSPLEAGLSWAIDLEHAFPGRDALLAQRDKIERRLTCLVSEGQSILRGHQPVFCEGEPVSALSSGGFSPTLGRSIGMAYLPSALAHAGVTLDVVVRDRNVPCRTVKRPFYASPDPALRRPA